MELEREVRFAVVLYGGVSLAIYINGVVQELYRLVRASAPVNPLPVNPENPTAYFPEGSLQGSEKVYRKLSQSRLEDRDRQELGEYDPVRTRFVVDILAGSSAGGINAIFLAKALANQQGIGGLRQLWIEEGDIAKLLNEPNSYEGIGVTYQKPPASLLNGQRLYSRALSALCGMSGTEEKVEDEFSPSYAEELDLTVTTTDLQGLPMPIRTSDRIVYERRHRKAFEFKYSTESATGHETNDFTGSCDRLLAFAARCTSSFPFAFEPVTLDDVRRDPDEQWPPEQWRSFFAEYTERGARFEGYAFADGGYLDNKPFSAATRNLRRRRADVPVDRKLIYVEPDPTDVTTTSEAPALPAEPPKNRPDAPANVLAALSLPRVETIREDIADIADRNRVLERLHEVTVAIEREVVETQPGENRQPQSEASPLATAAYEALRIQITIDDLSKALARVGGLVEASEEAGALRRLVRAWFDGEPQQDPATFLERFDLRFSLRRLYFLHDRINELLRGNDRASTLREMAGAEQEGREPALRALKLDLNGVLTDLRRPSWTVQRPDGASDAGEANELHALFDEGGITRKVLLDIVGASSPAGAAEKQLARAELSARLDRAMERLAAAFCAPLKKAEEKAPRLIGAKPLGALSNLLLGYYNRFESFDAVTLPLYHPDLSEVNQVEIVRVSPEDARSLIDESKEGATRGKLAGTSVAHFGGFLDEHWRRNDLMWGRLDGVERILVSMLPEGTHRTDLLNEAQAAIIREELLDEDAGPLTDLMAGALSIGDDLSPADVTTLCTGTASQQRQAFLLQLRRLPDPILLAHFRAHYEVPRELDRAKMLKLAGRGTRITGDVMRGSSEKRGRSVKAWFWVSRLGGLLWGFAELAVPDPDTWLTTRLRRNAIQLALIVAAALIVLGLLLGFDGTQKVGWVLLLAVLAGTAMVWIARDLMTGQRFGVLAVAIGLLVAVILVFAGLEAVLHFKADLRSVLPGDEHQGLERLIFNGVRSLWPG